MVRDSSPTSLLGPNALEGLRVAISVSESADLGRLGLVEIHLRLALGEIARSVLVGNGKLAYGGHLDPSGYTSFLVRELHRYGRRDQPLRVCLAFQEHRKLSLTDLSDQKREVGLFGEIVCLSADGKPMRWDDGRGEAAVPVTDDETKAQSLTSLRRYMAGTTDARVLLGGKRAGFQGGLPGLFEEALLSLEAGQPLFLVGGFGGVTADIIHALTPDNDARVPPLPNAVPPDPKLSKGLSDLSQIAKDKSWKGLDNGLSPEENQALAATPRPSEIAALISLGLGRRLVGVR
jgi:SLOG cluster2